MSILRWVSVVIIGALSLQFSTNTLANPKSRVSQNRMDIYDTEFCREIRYNRESSISNEPDLISGAEPVHVNDRAMCFSPDENLFFIANREAQKILGPHAPWYLKVSADFRDRVQKACKIMGFENDDFGRSYDQCVESRFEELMGPYETRYRREANGYITKRRQIAESLVVRCDAALSIKRSRLPRDIRFPIAYYDPNLHSVPQWLLESRMDDEEWLKRMSKLKVNDIMHDVLGNECPGNMVYWVTYNGPE